MPRRLAACPRRHPGTAPSLGDQTGATRSLAQGPASGREAQRKSAIVRQGRAAGEWSAPSQLLLGQVDHRLALERVVLGRGSR